MPASAFSSGRDRSSPTPYNCASAAICLCGPVKRLERWGRGTGCDGCDQLLDKAAISSPLVLSSLGEPLKALLGERSRRQRLLARHQLIEQLIEALVDLSCRILKDRQIHVHRTGLAAPIDPVSGLRLPPPDSTTCRSGSHGWLRRGSVLHPRRRERERSLQSRSVL